LTTFLLHKKVEKKGIYPSIFLSTQVLELIKEIWRFGTSFFQNLENFWGRFFPMKNHLTRSNFSRSRFCYNSPLKKTLQHITREGGQIWRVENPENTLFYQNLKLMQNLKARAPKEFVLFSLFVFYKIIIGHSISVLFSVEISLFFDNEIGKNLGKKNF